MKVIVLIAGAFVGLMVAAFAKLMSHKRVAYGERDTQRIEEDYKEKKEALHEKQEQQASELRRDPRALSHWLEDVGRKS